MHPLTHAGRRALRRRCCRTRTARRSAWSCRGSTASRASSRSCGSASSTSSRAPPGTMRSPHEYGFYANVNPQVDHPRWSQASERRIARALQTTQDADVQRLRRPGRVAVRGDGPRRRTTEQLQPTSAQFSFDSTSACVFKASRVRARAGAGLWLAYGALDRQARREPGRDDRSSRPASGRCGSSSSHWRSRRSAA